MKFIDFVDKIANNISYWNRNSLDPVKDLVVQKPYRKRLYVTTHHTPQMIVNISIVLKFRHVWLRITIAWRNYAVCVFFTREYPKSYDIAQSHCCDSKRLQIKETNRWWCSARWQNGFCGNRFVCSYHLLSFLLHFRSIWCVVKMQSNDKSFRSNKINTENAKLANFKQTQQRIYCKPDTKHNYYEIAFIFRSMRSLSLHSFSGWCI